MPDPIQLRTIPSVDRLLRSELLEPLGLLYPHSTLVMWARGAIEEYRDKIQRAEQLPKEDPVKHLVSRIIAKERIYAGAKIRAVINATGVILHTNLGRAPLAKRAVQRIVDAAGTANVEMNLNTGKRNHRGQHCVDLLCQLTKCEDAVLVNNCAAATMMVLQSVASHREVIISRSQLVEIGGGFRLPDVFRSAGVSLREVGTTNRTYVHDYETAISEKTAAVMRVHHSNYKMSGFVTEPTIAELVQMDKSNAIAIIDDLGSGWLGNAKQAKEYASTLPFLISEPSVHASISAGADLTLFSGDKLLGGPQCGIILGKRSWVQKLKKSPLMRAMRLDKLVLAALEATLEIHLEGRAETELPIHRMLTQTPAAIKNRCEHVSSLLNPSVCCRVVECESQIGGGSMPGEKIESFGINLEHRHPNLLAAKLRENNPSVHARVTNQSVLLDMRTVPETMTEVLADCVRRCYLDEPITADDHDVHSDV